MRHGKEEASISLPKKPMSSAPIFVRKESAMHHSQIALALKQTWTGLVIEQSGFSTRRILVNRPEINDSFRLEEQFAPNSRSPRL